MIRRSLLKAALAVVAASVMTVGAMAQGGAPRVSPPGTAEATIGGQKITITYHRPSVKGREVLGNLIPYGKVWRLGANEATKLTTSGAMEINGLKIPAGEYSMFMLVTEEGGPQLIVNKVANQWGSFKYDQGQDLGRVTIEGTRDNAHTEQFTITLESTGAKAGRLGFAWGSGKAYADVRVP